MKVTEIQKSHFNLGYRAVVQINGEDKKRVTKWCKTYVSLKATLKAYGVTLPSAKELHFLSNGFDSSFAIV